MYRADTTLIKRLNEIRLLNLLREESPISRNELARRARISKVAASDIVNRLDRAGFILTVGKGETTRRGGKPPILLKLNPNSGYVVGVEIKRRRARVALGNVESTVLTSEEVEYAVGTPMEQVLEAIFAAIDGMFTTHPVPAERFISIGVAIPGIVDYQKGELSYADTLHGWAHKPLATHFARRYRVPVQLENDVKVVTLGESLLGAGRGVSNMVCLWIGEGVGSGIILDGQLVRGGAGNAGEIGYLEVGYTLADIGRMQHLYRGQRFLGDLLSECNLQVALARALGLHLEQLTAERGNFLSVLRDGDLGNVAVRECLGEYAYPLAALCMAVIKMLNPTLVVLCGDVVEHSKYLVAKVRKTLVEEMANFPFRPSSVIVGQLRQEAGIKGAIALALLHIFEPPVVSSRNHWHLHRLEFNA